MFGRNGESQRLRGEVNMNKNISLHAVEIPPSRCLPYATRCILCETAQSPSFDNTTRASIRLYRCTPTRADIATAGGWRSSCVHAANHGTELHEPHLKRKRFLRSPPSYQPCKALGVERRHWKTIVMALSWYASCW